MGALMTVGDRWRFDAPSRSGTVSKDDDLLRASIAHQLRNFCFENLDVVDYLKTPANTHRVSGAILYSLQPKQIRLLIDDARTSIVLALQRHFGNERYRKRLMTETHYRI